MADELNALTDRPNWTVTAGVATYEPTPGAWLARIRAIRIPGRAGDRWHIAIIDPRGMARYTNPWQSPAWSSACWPCAEHVQARSRT